VTATLTWLDFISAAYLWRHVKEARAKAFRIRQNAVLNGWRLLGRR
jgi:hypothetical protein